MLSIHNLRNWASQSGSSKNKKLKIKKLTIIGCALAASLLSLATLTNFASPGLPVGSSDVLTQHNDNDRSGAYLTETQLNPSNVNSENFGRLYYRHVDGQVLAQPLYVQNVDVPGEGKKNIFYIATATNKIYAFDADELDTDPFAGLIRVPPSSKNPRELDTTDPLGRTITCPETRGPVGITSTPVIDRDTGTMYVVTRKFSSNPSDDGSNWIHAIDIATLEERPFSPVRIEATDPENSSVIFRARCHRNRPGLLLLNGVVYLAFATFSCDAFCSENKSENESDHKEEPYHGWVIGYRASDLTRVARFCTSSYGGGAGIWQSGNGLAGATDGTIYFETGNDFDSHPAKLGDSFVKLQIDPTAPGGLSLAGFFNADDMNHDLRNTDTDLGSGGPLLLPGNRLIGGGKQGVFYLLDRTTMIPPLPFYVFQGFYNTWHLDSTKERCCPENDPGCPEFFRNGKTTRLGHACYIPPSDYNKDEHNGPNIHGGPIFWRGPDPSYGWIYGMAEKDYLKGFRYNLASNLLDLAFDWSCFLCPVTMSSNVRSPDGMPGGALSLSANGNTGGIVWALFPKQDGQYDTRAGRLVAFDATDLHELWRDEDNIAIAKFNPPTIADGKVFRATFADKVIVYGLGGSDSVLYKIDQKYENFGGRYGIQAEPKTPPISLPDGGMYQDFNGTEGRYNLPILASIYWRSDIGAHEIHGAIYEKWQSLGLQLSTLGYPITDERGAPDNIGRYNHFEHGSIYWTLNTGAHEIHGPILNLWAKLGYERSGLGYPTSDVDKVCNKYGCGNVSKFQHGYIYWFPATGAYVKHCLFGSCH